MTSAWERTTRKALGTGMACLLFAAGALVSCDTEETQSSRPRDAAGGSGGGTAAGGSSWTGGNGAGATGGSAGTTTTTTTTTAPFPEPDTSCDDGGLVACATGRGPSGLGDAVYACEAGEVVLTTCWDHCRSAQQLPRTLGCVMVDGRADCQCEPWSHLPLRTLCTSATTSRWCPNQLTCNEESSCDDVCGGPGSSAGCGLYWQNPTNDEHRQEGCLCRCDTPGEHHCGTQASTCNIAPLCPEMEVCDENSVWLAVNGYEWCAGLGLVPNDQDPFCDQSKIEYDCVTPGGCNDGEQVCYDAGRIARCTNGDVSIDHCLQVCVEQGHTSTAGCQDDACVCFTDPCVAFGPDPVCDGVTMAYCSEQQLHVVACDDYCESAGMISTGGCVLRMGVGDICSCREQTAEELCSESYWSGGGADCLKRWNGSQCCSSCIVLGEVIEYCD